MPLNQLSKTQWQAYFERLARALRARQVHVEATGLGFGQGIHADYLPLACISYDPRNDVLGVTLDGVEHLIHTPKQVYVDRELDAVRGIEVLDAGGERHILLFRSALELPAS